jgi:hypothetical protein
MWSYNCSQHIRVWLVSGLSLSGMDSYIGSYDESSQVDTATNTEDQVLYGTGLFMNISSL